MLGLEISARVTRSQPILHVRIARVETIRNGMFCCLPRQATSVYAKMPSADLFGNRRTFHPRPDGEGAKRPPLHFRWLKTKVDITTEICVPLSTSVSHILTKGKFPSLDRSAVNDGVTPRSAKFDQK